MPSYITPIQHTRSFSLKPVGGLRYGNFEGYVHLPPVVDTPKLGVHSFSSLNNQQIYKTVCEWFELWRPWQQKVLLCGIVNRCSLRQVDILATTLEPLRHRDYVVAVQHHYPTTPLKKIRDRNEKKKKKKRKGKKKKAAAIASVTTESTANQPKVSSTFETESSGSHFVTHIDDGAESPVSIIDSGAEQNVAERAALKIESYLQSAIPHADSLHDFADDLAGRIIQEAYPSVEITIDVHTEQYAENLARSILTNAMDTVSKSLEEKEEKTSSGSAEAIFVVDTGKEKQVKTKFASKGPELSDVPEEVRVSRAPTQEVPERSKSFRARSPIIDTIIESRSKTPKQHENEEEVQEEVQQKKSESPTSQVRIITPGVTKTEKNGSQEENVKRVQSGHSGVSRSLSAITHSSISKMRYSLFGSTAVSTPDFFQRRSKDKLGPGGPGPMQRELRQGKIHYPDRLHNIPVPASRLYKSVRWWPDAPREGKIFFKAQKKDLSTNFKDQLQQVWDWMDLWEDYEKIALLKELLKICGPENLGFLSSHIQQQLRDTREINRLSDKLLLYIFSYLSSEQLGLISRVCRRWRFLCATDDLWMIKCHELGLAEGIHNLEKMILKSKKQKMGIDWRLAYEELRRITQMMKLGFSLSDKKKKDDKKVNFKDQLKMLQQKASSEFDSDSDSAYQPTRFQFKNLVTLRAQPQRDTLNREELHSLLKRMLFTPEGHPPVADKLSLKGEPQIVELEVLRGTMSAVKKMKHKKTAVDDDARSVISEDLSQFDEEYKILKDEPPDTYRKSTEKLHRGLSHVTVSETVDVLDTAQKPPSKPDDQEILKRGGTGIFPMRPPILRRTTEIKDDAGAEDAAFDIRPELIPAVDIMGRTKPQMSLKWHKHRVQEEDDSVEPHFVGMVKSVLRARKLQGHMNGILCIQFDHRRLISAGLDRVIRMWDIRSGRSIHKFYGHKGGIRSLQFSGNELITGSWDTTIMVWDLRNLCRKYILTDHMDSVSCLQFNQDYLVSGSHDRTVRVWRRNTYMCHTVIHGHSAAITCLAFDGVNVASGSMDMTIRLSNILTGECHHVMRHSDDIIHTVLIKGSLIMSGDPKGKVYFWNKLNGECEAAIQAHKEPIHKLAFLDGRFFTASGDGTIREWDLVTMTSVRLLQGHKGAVRDIKVSHNRIVSCSDDGSIRIWDLFDPRKKLSAEVQIKQLHQE